MKINVSKDYTGIRIDKLMMSYEPAYARNQIQQWIKAGNVLVNNMEVKSNYKCKENDVIEWEIPKEIPVEILPEPTSLDVIYEDDYLIVINKEKGMLVHPTQQEKTNTLVNGLLYYYNKLSTLSGEIRPGIVHRLDRDTSGVMVIAKDDLTHHRLQEQFKQQSVKRIYEAIVYGIVDQNKGMIKAPIARHPTQRLKRIVDAKGKEAETHFQVLNRMKDYTHLQCELITGRTHQIRVHLDYINHPIVGDTLYNVKSNQPIEGQALYAKEIEFIHPHTNEKMRFTVKQPTYFMELLQMLERMS